MAFIPAANVAKVEVRLQQYGQLVENTLYFRFGSDPSEADLQTLADAMSAWWTAEVKPIQSNTVTMREVYVTSLTSDTAPTATSTNDAGDAGAQGGTTPPSNVTVSIRFKTNARGRSGRGRNYWIGLLDTDITDNAVASLTLLAIIDAYDVLRTAPPTGWEWGVLSLYHNNAPRMAGLFQPITSVGVADTNVDSMRRRLTGRGS